MKNIVILSLIITAVFTSCKEDNKEIVVIDTAAKNEVIDAIMTRRSIRKYTEEQVSKELIDTIMKCAIYAPSALNRQSWELRVVQNQRLLNEINNRFLNYAQGKSLKGSAANADKPGFSVFHHAPTLIIVGRDLNNPYSQVDCGFMSQNILLSAHALGLGTCPIGSVVPVFTNPDNSDLLEMVNMPEDYGVAFCIALGYPDEAPEAKKRIAEKVKIIQ